MALPAAAEVEEITVGGSIQVRGQMLEPGYWEVGRIADGPEAAQEFIPIIGFNDDINGMDWITQRTRVNVDAKLSGGVRGFVELQAYDFWGVDPDDIDLEAGAFAPFPHLPEQKPYGLAAGQGDDLVRLYQAYIEMNDIADYPLQVRIGRQELVYGREWLVGNNSAGVNFSGLAFDGVKASYDDEMFRVDAWWTKLVDLSSPIVPDRLREQDADIDFFGVYGTYKGIENMVIDAYWLWVRNAQTTITAGLTYPFDTKDTDNLHTVGGRVAGAWDVMGALPGMLDYNVEAAFQFGNNNVGSYGGSSGDYKGWAFNAMAGYTFTDVEWTPRVEAEYAYFSGDDDYDDGDTEEFIRLFSDVHYGELNLGGSLDTGATNLHIVRLGASAVPVEKLTVKGDFYLFWLAEDDEEGLGKTFGVEQLTSDVDDNVGYELDIIADYQYTEDLNLRVGWAHFFADDAIENSWGGGLANPGGGDDDVDYVYVQALLVF
jgi:hypothetical protein